MRPSSTDRCRSATIRRLLPLLLATAGALGLPALPASAASGPPSSPQAPQPAALSAAVAPGRAEVEALMRSAAAGNAADAERLAGLYERESGLLVWDPPSALRWYAVAALAGSRNAGEASVRLWKQLAPTHSPRAEALLARNFSDEELDRIGIGPVRRELLKRQRWAAAAEPAGFADPRPVPAALIPAPTTVAAAPAAIAPAPVTVAPAPVTVAPVPVMVDPASASVAPAPAPVAAAPATAAVVPALAANPVLAPAAVTTGAAPATAATETVPKPKPKPGGKTVLLARAKPAAPRAAVAQIAAEKAPLPAPRPVPKQKRPS